MFVPAGPPRLPHATIVSSATKDGLSAHTSIETACVVPVTDAGAVGPTYQSFVPSRVTHWTPFTSPTFGVSTARVKVPPNVPAFVQLMSGPEGRLVTSR